MRICYLAYSFIAFALSGDVQAFQAPLDNYPVARTTNGSYKGIYLPHYNQDLFLGVPYAHPPIETLRFRNPAHITTNWTGERPATKYAFECIGYGGDQKGYLQSEDCLYLNVIRPHGFENEALPVLVWIHGGGFRQGGTVDRRYNLTFIVDNSVNISKPMMAVSIAYRLGPFGFFNGDDVAAEGALNLGLKDQRLALHWIQENIAGFGGDPRKVTIYGQSAGSESVGYHLRAFNGRDDDLFRAGIMESGPVIPQGPLNLTASYQSKYEGIVGEAGCSEAEKKLDCLRALPFTVLNNVLNQTEYNTGWGPTIDGDFVARYPSQQVEDGSFVRVPIIAGTTTDEGSTQSPKPVNTTTELRGWMNTSSSYQLALPDPLIDTLLNLYPNTTTFGIPSSSELGGNVTLPQPYGAAFRQSAAYFTDQVFTASRRRTCEAWAAHNVSAYCYRFNTKPATSTWVEGVAHFSDVAFIFNNLEGYGYSPNPFDVGNLTESYILLSYLMAGSWASFVSDLDPNGWTGRGRNATRADWPLYTVDRPLNMVWDANITSYVEVDDWRKEGIALINEVALAYGR
ncbi:Carboxylesterase family protein [Aspergillus parasiticus SU-1]|uniref:Carboxylic ester hydrolase n=1 Tax=Aspergillus parasiticus (strain ATCC 56775 / NRRL 5862 / SRRC 143 / SU-1) TaxID=1403190 RepID=A0A0F0IB24_ASPPU|nr:Carboxylesterase family protein [Aspergillus parasiticus SU-1]